MSRPVPVRVSFGMSILILFFLPALLLAGASIAVPSSGLNTITEAMVRAKAGDTVLVNNGTYREHVYVKAGVVLKARLKHRAVIDGNGRETVITLGKHSGVSGLVIRNGTIGVFSNGAGAFVESCQIIRNWQTGIIVVRHLPRIEDNVIAFNRASGIQGWDVRSTVAAVNHNTIAYNANHGIALGGSSNIIIENNVIAHNERFGLKISDESAQSKVTKNNFYRNLRHVVPSGNYAFDPAFMSPRAKLDFRPDPKLCCQIKASDNENLGARLGY